MIILPDLRRVIVTPPRCGSTTLRAMLVERKCENRGFLVLDSEKELHTPFIPQFASDFEVSLLVRNPYARAASLWKRMHQFRNKPPNFRVYAADLAAGRIDRWFIGWTCSDYEDAICCAGYPSTARKPDHIIHLETLGDDLRQVGVDEPVVHRNASDNAPLDELYTPAAREHIRKWATTDFERYGYMVDFLDGTCVGSTGESKGID